MSHLGRMISVGLIITAASASRGDELDTWLWRNPRPHNQQVFSMTRGNGLWLIGAHNGTIATSVDGIDWDLSTLGTNAVVSGAAWGNGRFVLCAGSRGIFTSVDGHNWSKSSTTYLSELAFGNGRFVGVDGSGATRFSTDGASWTLRQLSFNHLLRAISFANGLFFALGQFNNGQFTYFTSPDGDNWSDVMSLGTNGVGKLVYGNGRYVGLWSDILADRSEFRTSTDGVIWSAAVVFNGYNINDIVVADGRFVAVDLYSGSVLTSTNGLNWTEQAVPELFSSYKLLWAEGTFVSAGLWGVIVTSTNGSNWVRRTIGADDSLSGIIQNQGLLVAVGGNLADEGTTLSAPTVLTSTDGRSWVERSPGTTQSLAAVTFGDNRYAAVGAAGTTVYSSDAASTWTAAPAVTTNTLFGVAHGNGRFVAVGGGARAAILSSGNGGASWADQPTASAYPKLNGVAYGQGQFVAVGNVISANTGNILFSPDGLTWTQRFPATTNSLRAVAFANGLWVAVGDRGGIMISGNGVNWTNYSRNNHFSLRSVAYGHGWWVAVGTPSGLYTSPDGVNWTFRPSLTLTTIYSSFGVAYGGNSFYVVGPLGQILESRPFNPLPRDTVVRLRYPGAPFLTISGPEARQYEIQAADSLNASSSWAAINTVSNLSATTTLPVGTALNPPSRFYRARLLP